MLSLLLLSLVTPPPFDLAIGQVTVQPATQAEVGAGTVAWKYVSPLTLSGSGGFAAAAASDYAIRANITNDSVRLMTDKLVSDLVAAGIWTNFIFLYPFPTTFSNDCAQNLVSSNYPITWNGTVAFTNGFTPVGSGYGKTTFSPTNYSNPTNAFLYAWVAVNQLGTTGPSGPFLGALNGASDCYLQLSVVNGTDYSGDGSVNDTLGAQPFYDQTPFFPGGNFMVWRTNDMHSIYEMDNTGVGRAATSINPSTFGRVTNYLYIGNIQSTVGTNVPAPSTSVTNTLGVVATGYSMTASQISNFFRIINTYVATRAAILNNPGVGSIATNTASFTIVTNDWVLNQYYTNANQRAWVQGDFVLSAAAAGTASVGLFVDQNNDGAFELTNNVVSAGPLAALVSSQFIGGFLNPSARFVFTNVSTGVGSTAATRINSSQWVKQ